MIDLTPLDVRKKRDDFRKGLRGYETQEVDAFLELVAERLEELVKENLTLTERAERLAAQVDAQTGRERAVHEALVTAQELREEIRGQAQKEADRILRDAERDAQHREREAELQAREILADAERLLKEREVALEELERRRTKFLNAFRQLLQREMDVVAVEEGRPPLADVAVELDLGGGRDGAVAVDETVTADSGTATGPEGAAEVEPAIETRAAAAEVEAAAAEVEPAIETRAAAAEVEAAAHIEPAAETGTAPHHEPAASGEDAEVPSLADALGVPVEPAGDDDEPVVDIGLLAGPAVPEDEAVEADGGVAVEDAPAQGDPGSAPVEAASIDQEADAGERRVERPSPHADIPTLEMLLGEGEEDADTESDDGR